MGNANSGASDANDPAVLRGQGWCRRASVSSPAGARRGSTWTCWSTRRRTIVLVVRVSGQRDLIDAFEMACSLGPIDCLVLDCARAEIQGYSKGKTQHDDKGRMAPGGAVGIDRAGYFSRNPPCRKRTGGVAGQQWRGACVGGPLPASRHEAELRFRARRPHRVPLSRLAVRYGRPMPVHSRASRSRGSEVHHRVRLQQRSRQPA